MPDEFDRQVEDLLNGRLCTQCKKEPRDPQWADWGMCTACGQQASDELVAWYKTLPEPLEEEPMPPTPRPTLWERLCRRLDGKSLTVQGQIIFDFFWYREDDLVLSLHPRLFPHVWKIGRITVCHVADGPEPDYDGFETC